MFVVYEGCHVALWGTGTAGHDMRGKGTPRSDGFEAGGNWGEMELRLSGQFSKLEEDGLAVSLMARDILC